MKAKQLSEVPSYIRVNLIGQTFGDWTVIAFAERRVFRCGIAMYWRCRCVCGTICNVQYGSLKAGNSRRCRKCAERIIGAALRKHGMSKIPEYVAWLRLQKRAKGWDDFAAFLSDVGRRPPGTRISRIDKTKPHGQGNTTWLTPTHRNRLDAEQVAELLGRPQDEKFIKKLSGCSRQFRWQLRMKATGMCRLCGGEQCANRQGKNYCESCQKKRTAVKQRRLAKATTD